LEQRHHQKSLDLATRTSIVEAEAWVDDHTVPLDTELVAIGDAVGRVLAQEAVAAIDFPFFDQAAIDGLAIHVDDAAGASTYNPLVLEQGTVDGPLLPTFGVAVSVGDRLPADAEAILPIGQFEARPGGRYEVIEAAVPGSGITPKGSHFVKGTRLLGIGQRPAARHVGILLAAGLSEVQVVRRPVVRCLLLARSEPLGDQNGPMLTALVDRDGGLMADMGSTARDQATLCAALSSAAAEPDVILVVGGTGQGSDDASAAALAEAGELAAHGIALAPGETAGYGLSRNGVPVFLLPGSPTSCLWAYELLAGRAIRRLGGRGPAPAYPVRQMTTARKIVSAIGTTEICPMRRLDHDRAEPIVSYMEGGLGTVARADGFVIVPEGSEGYPAGAIVRVHLYEDFDWAS
jgi:molybdopterin molybdotransferase